MRARSFVALLCGLTMGCARADGGEVALDAEQPPRTDAMALAALLTNRGIAIDSARAALDADASWRATAALAPLLADSARTDARLLAAAAAAMRDEWSTVERLVASVPDSTARGFAPLLRARAVLARNDARAALDAARRAAALAPVGTERGVRLTLVARALDRLASAATDTLAGPDARARALADSARDAYRAAARQLPEIADWLTLRAAELTFDATARASALGTVRLPAARGRVAASEATARERSGDRAGAAAAYSALGRRAKALALQLVGASDATRAAVRDSLDRLLASSPTPAESRAAIELLDARYGSLGPNEELLVARSGAAPAARALQAYARALGAGLGTARDRTEYAALLARAGRSSDAIAQYAAVRAAGGALAGQAAYQRARLLQRTGNGAAARAALREVADMRDAEASPNALALLADLAVDDGDDAGARALLLRLVREHPRSSRAPKAAFDAAIIALAHGDRATAARELQALRGAGLDSSSSDVRVAATYWAGRADASVATARWTEVLRQAPESYYAVLAARRLRADGWRPPNGAAPTASDSAAAAVRRMALLERVGFDPEVGWEREALADVASRTAEDQLSAAAALGDAGATSSAMRVARRALDRGAPASTGAYRLVYPWPWERMLRAAASARDLDPALAAAVIRQESNFTPGATSPAGAVGLMQLIPSVGRALWDALGARRAGVPWSVALLREPDVNVALGTAHLASALGDYPDPAYAIAAYNAGGTPVSRWRKRSGADDPELFVERIPYDETRDYVRIVTRNRAMYAALYSR